MIQKTGKYCIYGSTRIIGETALNKFIHLKEVGVIFNKVKSFFEKLTCSDRRLTDSIENLCVLYIGGYWRGQNDMVKHMMLGLQDAGVQVIEYNTDEHQEALDTEGRPYDRGTSGPVWIRKKYLDKYLEKFKPHIIVCNAGGLSFSKRVSKKMRRRYYLLGIALSDPDVFEPTTKFIAPNFDLFLTNDKSLLVKYDELGANTGLLRLGTNEKYFRPLPPLEKYKTDVLIIGRALPNRVEPVKAIVEQFDTIVYGEGWEKHGVKSQGTIFGDEMMQALNSARIVPVFLSNPTGESMFVKIGILDFTSAGALLLTNYLPDIENYLTFDKEIIGFNSTGELISKIEYYLSHPEEAEKIRRAGFHRVRQEHTWANVWKRILSDLIISNGQKDSENT